MATWQFTCRDNGGKFQTFKVKAASKPQAIDKAMEKAKKHAAGDISPSWECRLVRA